MVRVLQFVSVLMLTFGAIGQTVIAENDFDASTGLVINATPATYNVSGDVWGSVADFASNITAGNPGNFWGMRDLNNPNGGGDFAHTLAVSGLDISTYVGVELTFDYNVVGFDTNDSLSYQLTYDGVDQGWVSVVLGATGGISSNDWDTVSVMISDAVSSVGLTIAAAQNGGSDYAGVDNVKFVGNPAAAGCNLTNANLTNIICNDNNTPNIESDDYFTFELNPAGVDLGSNYTVTISTGTVSPATAVAYGSATTFSTEIGSAGAGDVMITITDDVDGGCTLMETVTDPGICSSAIPEITVAPSILTGFDYIAEFETSPEMTFEVSGITLTADIVLTAPANYMISETMGGAYSSTITLTQTAGTVNTTTIYVVGTSTTAGQFNEEILATSTGAINDTVYVQGSVTAYTEYTIAQVTNNDANGTPDSANVLVNLHGKIHCIDFDGDAGYSFVIIDESDAGITVFDFNDVSEYTNPSQGDSIRVFGFISSFNGLTQLRPDSIELLSQFTSPIVATVVTSLDETTESQYITLEGMSLVTAIPTFEAGSANYDITDGTNTYIMRIDSDTDLAGAAAPQGTFSVTGIGGQFDNSSPYDEGYQILPCGMMSIVEDCATPTVTVADNVLTASSAGATYQWIDCATNMPIAGETSQSYTPTENGSYAVEVTENGCVETSECYTISTIGLEENTVLTAINVYPNPMTEVLTIANSTNEAVFVSIVDVNGRTVVAEEILKVSNTINVSNWSNGVYFVKVRNNNAERTIKVIK